MQGLRVNSPDRPKFDPSTKLKFKIGTLISGGDFASKQKNYVSALGKYIEASILVKVSIPTDPIFIDLNEKIGDCQGELKKNFKAIEYYNLALNQHIDFKVSNKTLDLLTKIISFKNQREAIQLYNKVLPELLEKINNRKTFLKEDTQAFEILEKISVDLKDSFKSSNDLPNNIAASNKWEEIVRRGVFEKSSNENGDLDEYLKVNFDAKETDLGAVLNNILGAHEFNLKITVSLLTEGAVEAMEKYISTGKKSESSKGKEPEGRTI